MNFRKIIWFKLRLVMGLIFLWAFADKLLGLGYATTADKSWVKGGSPTYGFLTNATRGPFAEFFKKLPEASMFGGVSLVDWAFMLGLLFVGLTLVFNKFVILGAMAGSIMLILMYLAVFPPDNNPLLDEHIVYILVLGILALKSKERR